MSNQASKVMTQAKLTSNMTRAFNGLNKGFWSSKSNNSDDCIIVEKPRSHNNQVKGHGASPFSKVEDEDRAYGSASGAKRAHMEISSPRIDNAKSLSSNEEANADASGNGFVTARAKLVFIFL